MLENTKVNIKYNFDANQEKCCYRDAKVRKKKLMIMIISNFKRIILLNAQLMLILYRIIIQIIKIFKISIIGVG